MPMSPFNTDPQPLQSVTLAQLKQYLASTNWQPREFPNPRVDMYVRTSDENDPIQLVLPANAELVDTDQRIKEAIQFLADIDDREIAHVIADILAEHVDFYRPRLEGEGLPSLDTVANLLIGLRHFMVAGANHEMYQAPVVPQNRTAGQQYVQACRFGHTFAGSFGFTIESPIVGFKWDEYFGRHVMERIGLGLHLVADATRDGSAAVITDRYENGLNANMCETLIEVLPRDRDQSLIHTFQMSPSAPLEISRRLVEAPVVLTSDSIDILGRAATDLKAVQVERSLTISGQISQLRDDFDYAEYRTILIKWRDTEQNNYKNVYITLPPGAYRQACDAHRDRLPVSVSGLLKKEGRKWRLTKPVGFSVLSQK